ncbi:MAG: cysteine desulfurase, partial [Firmicutes bacterium]|nr:cysteine desulfurase [Bacillota bacterium]
MIAYLDNSATTRQYDEVTNLMASVAKNSYGNPSSLHAIGFEAEKLVKEGREQVARAIGCSPEEVFFTSGGTESDNTVIMGCAGPSRRPRMNRKRIITTSVEHPAVLEPVAELERQGFEVIRLKADGNCMVDPDELRNVLTEDTILISVMTVNNETGAIMPIEEIGRIKAEFNKAHGTSVLLHTDAVQAFGKIPIDMNGMFRDVDLLSLSSHKFHGPKGMGVLYARKGTKTTPFMLGGGQEKAFRSGTENVPGIAGTGLAAAMSVKDLKEKAVGMAALRDLLKERILEEIPDVRINSPEEGVCSVLNVSFLKTRGEVILHSLEQQGVYVSTGSACSSNHSSKKGSHVLNAMGLKPAEIEGALRFS